MATGRVTNIVVYADDPQALSDFWADALGHPRSRFEGEFREHLLANGLTESDLAKRGLAEDPTGAGPRFLFQHADAPKPPGARNRWHVDLQVFADRRSSDAELDAEKDRLVALGAVAVRLVEQSWGPFPERYWQLRDPEGNEFCLH